MTTLTHPARGDAEYTLIIFCDDPSHDECDIDVIGYWPKPPNHFGFLSWLTAGNSLQTPFGEKMAAERRAGGTVDLGGWAGTPKEMDYGSRWRFECEGCLASHSPTGVVPVNGKRMEEVLNRLREHGVSRLSLPQLADILKT